MVHSDKYTFHLYIYVYHKRVSFILAHASPAETRVFHSRSGKFHSHNHTHTYPSSKPGTRYSPGTRTHMYAIVRTFHSPGGGRSCRMAVRSRAGVLAWFRSFCSRSLPGSRRPCHRSASTHSTPSSPSCILWVETCLWNTYRNRCKYAATDVMTGFGF